VPCGKHWYVQKNVAGLPAELPSEEHRCACLVFEQSEMTLQYWPTPSELPLSQGWPHAESILAQDAPSFEPPSLTPPLLLVLLQPTIAAIEPTTLPAKRRTRTFFMPSFIAQSDPHRNI
jgi:hypothetical protein